MSTRCSLRTRPRSRLTWWLRLRGSGPSRRGDDGDGDGGLFVVTGATETSIVVARLIVLRFVLFPRHVTHILCSRRRAAGCESSFEFVGEAAATTSSSRRPSRRNRGGLFGARRRG